MQLTIEANVQQAAWDALGDYSGAVVALDPKTGAILAMVSKPSYDPNTLSVHSSQQFFTAYNALMNPPTSRSSIGPVAGDLYHPGSVFKLVVASAALDSGKATPDTAFPNPASLQLPLSSDFIQNSSGGPCGPGATATIATAIQLSCNIPMAQLGAAIGEATISEYATRFGYGKPFALAGRQLQRDPEHLPPPVRTRRT